MQIKVAMRLQPFTHRFGSFVLLPASPYAVRVFPTAFSLVDLSDGRMKEVASAEFALEEAYEGFTVFQDLEKGRVSVKGKSKAGNFAYYLDYSLGKVFCKLLAMPASFELKGELHLTEQLVERSFLRERLSFGLHKKLDWELVQRRLIMPEIFPLFLRLGMLCPQSDKKMSEEMKALFEELRLSVLNAHHREEAFRKFFLAAFFDLFVPQLSDSRKLGLTKQLSQKLEDYSPLVHLRESALLLRKMLFYEQDQSLFFGSLPKSWPCGRFCEIESKEATIHFEWSKGMMRRVLLEAKENVDVKLCFPKKIKSFRLRRKKSDKGCILSNYDLVSLDTSGPLLLDKFSK